MKKRFSFLIIIGLLLFVSMSADVGFAQTEEPETTDDSNTFTLSELGLAERFMKGPYDALDIYFSVPDYWRLTPSTYIDLTFDYTLGGAGMAGLTTEQGWIGGTLIVRLNDDIIMTALLQNFEEQQITIPIRAEALIPKGEDSRHHLRFYLDASENCYIENLQTTLWIDPDSTMSFAYLEAAPVTDLKEFPKPYYQPDSIVPAEVIIAVPENPTAADLEAGYSVVAGLGTAARGESIVTLKTFGDLTQDNLASNNIIFVGNDFAELESVEFPVTFSGGQLNLPEDKENNGVIQSVQSPWSAKNVIMLVSGNTDEALIKAAKAVSTGKLVTSGLSNVSLVDSVNPTEYVDEPIIDQALSALGFQTTGIGVYGDVYYDLKFNATAEQAVSEGAYFDFISTRSDLLDFDRSGLMILLNDEIVGTVGYTGQEQSVSTERIEILPNYLRRGENRLEIVSSLVPSDLCYNTNFEAAWVTVSERSNIHLPISNTSFDIGERFDLLNYPSIFYRDQQLSDLAFVVPAGNREPMQSASDIIYYLGSQATLSMANFEVYFADNVPQEVLDEKNIIFVGKASDFSHIEVLNENLPAPFEDGSNVPEQPSMPVNFDAFDDVPVGYIELVESPWNSERVIMMVLGNTDAGILQAKNALSQEVLINELAGDFAVVFDSQVITVDTRYISSSVSSGPIDADQQADDGSDDGMVDDSSGDGMDEDTDTDDLVTRPEWLQPTILGVTALMVLILIFVVVRYRIFNISGRDD
jgi:hypothetical protein